MWRKKVRQNEYWILLALHIRDPRPAGTLRRSDLYRSLAVPSRSEVVKTRDQTGNVGSVFRRTCIEIRSPKRKW